MLTLTNDALGALGGIGIIAVLAAYALLRRALQRLTAQQSGGMKLVWLVFIVVAPFIGSLRWFLFSKRSAYA